MSVPFDPATLAMSAAIVAAAYVVFGISAFGASLFTVPLLTRFVPLEAVLPMCVLLDVSASIALGTRFSREASSFELVRMVPSCLVGAVLGVTLLARLPRRGLFATFGLLEAAYGAYSLARWERPRTVSPAWAPLAGFAGGMAGTLFGVGAPPYAIYLSGRLSDSRAFRATLSNMVICSVAIRALVFAAGGLMRADRLAGFALLLPFALAGLWTGNRLHARMSHDSILRLVSALVLLTGISVLARALAGGS